MGWVTSSVCHSEFFLIHIWGYYHLDLASHALNLDSQNLSLTFIPCLLGSALLGDWAYMVKLFIWALREKKNH